MSGIEFRLLGPMEVRADGAPVPLPGAAERAVLALLLLSPGRTVATTSLVDLLWTPDTLPVDPVNALQVRVSKLRRALSAVGLDIVVRDAAGYRADVAAGSVDVERFTRGVRAARNAARAAGTASSQAALDAYDAALAMWRGDPLTDFVTEAWAAAEAAKLSQLWLAALNERAELALTLARHAEVAADLGPVVAGEPTHEALAGLLMTALYRGGWQAEALEVYGRTRSVLDDELGLEPSAELRALHQRILRQDPGLDVVSAPLPESPPPAQHTAAVGGHLPAEVRPLVGRDAELASLGELLDSTRLLTLVGPGGAGKTALALALARRHAPAFPDGARAVRLAAVTDRYDVPLAVADALGVPLDGAASGHARERIVSFLARRRLLLLLDNCEHVIDAAARLADDVLISCPDVTVLATSREALAVPGEVQVTVSPLAAPPPGTPADRVLDYPAAELFAQRAAAVRSGRRFDADDLAAVARLSVALDGMPLALELAAARVSALSPVELADRIADRFALLSGGARTADARHRTLRATVDWSHALLEDAERALFRRLAVFQGGWTLDAAEAVGARPELDRNRVLDVLGRLIEQSMVVAEPGHTTRYRMLETLRQYAMDRLVEAGEQEDAAAAHAAHFRNVVDEAEARMRGGEQRTVLRRLRDEQPNLRAALSWLAADPSRHEDALQLAGALGWFWHLGRHVEGRDVLRRLIATPGGSPAARARALQAVSLVERPRACLVHPSSECAETARESLALFCQVGDVRRAALSRVLLAVEGVRGSARDACESLLREAEEQFTRDDDAWGHAVVAFVRLETFLKAGDERAPATGQAAAAAFRALDDPWGLSAVLYHLGWGLRQFGRYAEAVPVLQEAVAVAGSAGLYNTVQWALADLGITLLYLGDALAAREHFDRARSASEEIGDGAGEVLAAFGYGLLAQVDGDWREARRRFTQALAGFDGLATPVHAGLALAGLARCDEQEGLLDAALDRYRRVLDTGESAGEPELTAIGLEGLARLAAARGRGDEAAGMRARAAAVRERTHRPAPPHERAALAAHPMA